MTGYAWSRIATRLIVPFIGLLCCAPTLAAASPCSSLTAPTVPGAQVLSITSKEAYNVTSTILPPFLYDYVGRLNLCNVTVDITHPGISDRVQIQLFLPLSNWNGRFQATGGGGFATSFGEFLIARGAKAGYASARTDGGIGNNFYDPSAWALLPNGSANVALLTNYASRSFHDMAVVGKAVTESFYGKNISYSYFTGCSTGGRQGLAEAQQYPEDYDGIVAAAPTLNWPSVMVADEWPQVVMNQEGYFPTRCEFQLFANAIVKKCDALDGVVDRVIADPGSCKFDPAELIGSKVVCDGANYTITEKTADIVHKILTGPTTLNSSGQSWGFTPGTDFVGTANTVTRFGVTRGVPFPVADSFIKFFLEKNPRYNTSSITYSEFNQVFAQANNEYNSVIAINNPDLSAFRAAGGKMITWQGLADNLVFSEGTVKYYQQVEKAVGKESTADFYRLFLAPGAGHCYGQSGPIPTDVLAPLVDWVEKGIAPETLPAQLIAPGPVEVTRNLCRYPLVSRYDGKGDRNSASSYTCATSFR